MVFKPDYIMFSPCKSVEQAETISLTNVKYRKAILDIHVSGSGNFVESFKLNGDVQEVPRLSAYVTGRQIIEIVVSEIDQK